MAVEMEYAKILAPIIRSGDVLPDEPGLTSSWASWPSWKYGVRNTTTGKTVAEGQADSKQDAEAALTAAYDQAVADQAEGRVSYAVAVPSPEMV
jgi:hypothetical protein